MSVISPGRALICRRMNSMPPESWRAGEVKPLAQSVCAMYCGAVEMPAWTGTCAHWPPGMASSLAASRARATASPDTVVTPSSLSSGLCTICANA
jgi:hypothetical protein